MKVRWVAFPLIAVAGWLIFILFKQLPSELAPLEDRGNLRMVVTGQEGATFEYMDRFMDQMIKLVKEDLPEHDAIITVTSPGFGASSSVNSGFMRLSLQPRESRARSQQEVAEYLGNRAKEYTGARVFITQEPTIGDRRSGLPVQYVIQASTIDRLKDVVPKFVEKAAANPAFKVVDVNLKFSKPEISLSIDRAKAQSMGVSVADIAQTLQLAFSGQRFGFFVMDGKQYQVIGQADRSFRDSPSDIGSLTVRTSSGDLVQLDNFVTIRESSMPPQLFRYNRFASATVSAGLNPGYTIGDGINIMDEISKNVLPDNFSTALSGESRDFQESSSSLMFAFLLALVLVYLVLAAQFESFRDPLIIMFTVPLAILGALGTLWLFGQSLNIFSQIGIIMLVGLVTKNGILMVEFANQRKATGLTKREAITDAAIARFRPILMTSISTILGTMPIALALGAGSESRISMGLAIVGGLTFATLLTLLVVPAVYSFISEEKKSVTNVEFV